MPLIVEGDLTPETIEALRAQAGRLDADMVVAVGGGRRWTPARRWRARCIAT